MKPYAVEEQHLLEVTQLPEDTSGGDWLLVYKKQDIRDELDFICMECKVSFHKDLLRDGAACVSCPNCSKSAIIGRKDFEIMKLKEEIERLNEGLKSYQDKYETKKEQLHEMCERWKELRKRNAKAVNSLLGDPDEVESEVIEENKE